MECGIFQSLLYFANYEELTHQKAMHHIQARTAPLQDSKNIMLRQYVTNGYPARGLNSYK